MNVEEASSLKETPHHKQLELCTTRAAYRQGRNLTAVKVYTVSTESQHLFVYGVPSLNLRTELKSVFNKYGEILSFHVVPQQKVERFTECYHVSFKRIQSARIAKRLVDNKSFYGGVLHVCYASEYETLEETSAKLEQRRKDVLLRLNKYNNTVHEISEVKQDETKNEQKEASQKRKFSRIEESSIYTEDDPILSLKKRHKRNTEESIVKYASQSKDLNGGLDARVNNSHVKNSKKFVPLPLRHKYCKPKVFGPQLPEDNSNQGIKEMKTFLTQEHNSQGEHSRNFVPSTWNHNYEPKVYGPQLPKHFENFNGESERIEECSSQENNSTESITLNQYDIRKVEKIEKRILFRKKIENIIS